MAVTTEASGQAVEVVCRPRNTEDQWLLEKRIRLDPKGGIQVSYRWNPVGLPADSFFSTELTLSEKLRIRVTPDVPLWTFAVQTVAKSERGLDETLQGESITARWPVGIGSASIEITPRPA